MIAYSAIVVHVQVLERLHEAPGHVASLCCLDSCVHKPLPPTHGVEEELSSAEPTVEGGGYKAFGLGGLVTSWEVRQSPVLQTAH